MSETVLNKGPGQKPLWSQLYEILQSRIETGVYEEGMLFPTEAELMKEFSVSRITVRQAMDSLMRQGYISRKRGSGTIVIPRPKVMSTSFSSSFKGIEHNHRQDRRVVSVEYAKVPQEASLFFSTPANMPLLTLTRDSYLSGKPIVRYVTVLSPAIPLDDTSDYSGSLYDLLEQADYPIDHVNETITASIASAEEATLFQITKPTAVIHRIRKGFSKDVPVEYTDSIYLSDDYKLTIDQVFQKGE